MDAQQLILDLNLVLSQTQIARALNVNQSIVSRWRSGNIVRVQFHTGAAMLQLHRQHASKIRAAKIAATKKQPVD